MQILPFHKESYFQSVVMSDENDCWLWEGPKFWPKGIPVMSFAGQDLIEAVRIGEAIKTGTISFNSRYKMTCKLNDCVNPAHALFWVPNASGRRSVAIEDRPQYKLQYEAISAYVSQYPDSKASDILAKVRAFGARVKSSTFSTIYHQVRNDLGLPENSVGRGRKKHII